MKSKNFKIGHSSMDVLKSLEMQDGVAPFLESQLLLRNSLPDEPLDMRLKKAGKLNLELRK